MMLSALTSGSGIIEANVLYRSLSGEPVSVAGTCEAGSCL